MSFWAYMLHCRGGYFYTGHTDNLEQRVAQHKSGEIPGFTADHQPVELVWSQEFSTRAEALEAERRIKGWSRAKKMALIRGDWAAISRLAKSKDSPSTSSGRTDVRGTSARMSSGRTGVRGTSARMSSGRTDVRGTSARRSLGLTGANLSDVPKTACPELVEGPPFDLTPHRISVPAAVSEISAKFHQSPTGLMLSYTVSGAINELVLPAKTEPARADDLWQTTCFELFLRGEGAAYREYNFSPSGEWAAYAFDSYRAGRQDIPAQIAITTDGDAESLNLTATLVIDLADVTRLALSAVMEERDGHKSYWAIAHHAGPPDFHHDACFVLPLADIGAA